MAQGRRSAMWAVAVLLVATTFVAVQAAVYNVGGADGWKAPGLNNALAEGYLQKWADGITFTEGDDLVFTYSKAVHNVVSVKEADFTACNFLATPIGVKGTSGLDTFKVPAGASYYICATPTHCSLGQKFNITAAPAKAGTPAMPSGSGAAPGAMAVAALQAFAAAAVAVVTTLW